MLDGFFSAFNFYSITAVTPIQGWGTLTAWGGKSTQITAMSPDMQREIAKAFELDDALFYPEGGHSGPICPGAIAAAIGPALDSPEQPLAKLQPDVRAKVQRLLPEALMRWLKILFIAQSGVSCALVAVNAGNSGTKLALISEQPVGSYVAIIPTGYIDEPSPGFLLCRAQEEGAMVKVGVGWGRNMAAATESKRQIEMFSA